MTNNTDKMRETFSTSIPTTAQGWAFALAEASNAAAKARAVADHETYLPVIRAIINQTLTHEREHAEMLAEALRRIAYCPLGGDAATYFCGVNMQNIAKEALATHETRKGNQDDKD